MKTVDLIYFDAGGGHRAAANALASVIAAQGRPWRVRRVHLFEVLDPQGRFRRMTGMVPEDYYNKRLARGWTLGLAQELKLLQGMIKLGHGVLVQALQQYWLAAEPDLVVSLVPNFNRSLHESLCSALPGVPFVTLLTDLADFPPHFWIEPNQQQDLICGTPRAVAQAQAAGYPPGRIHAVAGMVLRPDFYRQVTLDRSAERQRLGLHATQPTGLVMFGAEGASAMVQIATLLPDTPLILMCGRNVKTAARLRAMPAAAPRCVVGFTPDVQHYMQLADFFIGKPGPGSLSEAVQQHLPVIVARNAWTMPQERYNATWVRESGVGLVVRSFRNIAPAVAELTGRLHEFKAATARMEIRAVFEIPDILATILARSDRLEMAVGAH